MYKLANQFQTSARQIDAKASGGGSCCSCCCCCCVVSIVGFSILTPYVLKKAIPPEQELTFHQSDTIERYQSILDTSPSTDAIHTTPSADSNPYHASEDVQTINDLPLASPKGSSNRNRLLSMGKVLVPGIILLAIIMIGTLAHIYDAMRLPDEINIILTTIMLGIIPVVYVVGFSKIYSGLTNHLKSGALIAIGLFVVFLIVLIIEAFGWAAIILSSM